MKENDGIKQAVIDRIAEGRRWSKAVGRGPEKYDVGGKIVHARYCSPSGKSSTHYKFNINPNTLRSDYELWVCGNEQRYYLIPIRHIREMYEHPDAYPDKHHPAIRVVSVDVGSHGAMYAAGGARLDLKQFYRATL